MSNLKLVARRKQIHEMAVGEYGHISHSELRLDEHNYPWLNILGFVYPENRFVIKVSVERLTSGNDGYSIDMLMEESSDLLRDDRDRIMREGKYVPISNFKLSLSNSDDTSKANSGADVLPIDTDAINLEGVFDDDPQSQIDRVFSNIMRPNIDLKSVLSPLDAVFFPSEILDEVLIKLGVTDLLYGETPKFPGVILRGPPGTGKSVLQRAVAKVYENVGAYSQECNLAAMTNMYVGSLGRNIDAVFSNAVKEASERKKPSFLYFDEGTSLTLSMNADDTLRRYYQEALDALKKYIGNYREVVVCISTNAESSLFDQALVRDGRLAVIEVGYPRHEEIKRMWKYFIEKHNLIGGLSDDNYNNLAEIVPENVAGSFIEEFCRAYILRRKQILMREIGAENVLEALRNGIRIDDDQIRASISFDGFRYDVQKGLERKSAKNKKTFIGLVEPMGRKEYKV